MPPEQSQLIRDVNLPKSVFRALREIGEKRQNSGGHGGVYKGMWDVVAWRGDALRFFELKKAGENSLTSEQRQWIFAGLDLGFEADQFTVVEWSLAA